MGLLYRGPTVFTNFVEMIYLPKADFKNRFAPGPCFQGNVGGVQCYGFLSDLYLQEKGKL